MTKKTGDLVTTSKFPLSKEIMKSIDTSVRMQDIIALKVSDEEDKLMALKEELLKKVEALQTEETLLAKNREDLLEKVVKNFTVMDPNLTALTKALGAYGTVNLTTSHNMCDGRPMGYVSLSVKGVMSASIAIPFSDDIKKSLADMKEKEAAIDKKIASFYSEIADIRRQLAETDRLHRKQTAFITKKILSSDEKGQAILTALGISK